VPLCTAPEVASVGYLWARTSTGSAVLVCYWNYATECCRRLLQSGGMRSVVRSLIDMSVLIVSLGNGTRCG